MTSTHLCDKALAIGVLYARPKGFTATARLAVGSRLSNPPPSKSGIFHLTLVPLTADSVTAWHEIAALLSLDLVGPFHPNLGICLPCKDIQVIARKALDTWPETAEWQERSQRAAVVVARLVDESDCAENLMGLVQDVRRSDLANVAHWGSLALRVDDDELRIELAKGLSPGELDALRSGLRELANTFWAVRSRVKAANPTTDWDIRACAVGGLGSSVFSDEYTPSDALIAILRARLALDAFATSAARIEPAHKALFIDLVRAWLPAHGDKFGPLSSEW